MENLKNKIKYIIIAIVVLLMGAAVYVNVFSPLIVGEKYIEVEELDATEYSDTYFLDLEKRANGIKNGRSGLGEGAQALRTGDKLLVEAKAGRDSRYVLDKMYESAKSGSEWVCVEK